MKKSFIVTALVSAVLVAGCSTGTPKTPECPEGFDPAHRPELNGLSLVEATQVVSDADGELRVAYNNGESLALTMDYRENRVNVALDDNIVICSFSG